MKENILKSILVIDDEENIRDLLNRFLKKLNYKVDTAADLTEAVYSINKQLPDIIFLDIVLPGCNGIEILKLLKLFRKDIIVIMISGYADENLAKESLKKGAFDYLTKPFDISHIEDMLKLIDAKFV